MTSNDDQQREALARRRVQARALRWAGWVCVSVLVVHVIAWPSLLDAPKTHFGDPEAGGFAMVVRWPVVLVISLAVVAFRAASRRESPQRARGGLA